MTENTEKSTFKWRHPSEVMQIHQLKKKKRALQARMNAAGATSSGGLKTDFSNTQNSTKRKNPFLKVSDSKKTKSNLQIDDESSDRTLFKLFNLSNPAPSPKGNITSFSNILSQIENTVTKEEVKVVGEKSIPIDWALKTKVRFLSTKPLAWNQKLKISEEATGITSFTRCIDIANTESSLDTSSNSKFHQCSLYWQQPSLPWLKLFPRMNMKSSGTSVATNSSIKESLHIAWIDSFKSLFQLIRTKQCPYFYVCSNTFTVLFRAAGISGFSEIAALITPTTRGFRQLLKQEEIEFTMPLKKKRTSDAGYESLESSVSVDKENVEQEEDSNEEWMESMGINPEDIKQINYTQAKLVLKNESDVDNSEESLLLVEGPEVQALYSFLIHCKSAVAVTGPYAGIPPTLLAPVAFHGASLSALKVRESKVHLDNEDFYSLDMSGPILPHLIHNLCAIHPKDNSMTATFSNYSLTMPFSRVIKHDEKGGKEESGSAVFRQENLSDCGLPANILKHFCSDNPKNVTNIECLKYTAETSSYAWT